VLDKINELHPIVLYVQEVVTIQIFKKNIFASENEVYTIINYYDILD